MPFYLVKYTVSKNGEYVYPKNVAGVAWKSTVYHYSKRLMIGERDDVIEADGKDIVALSANEAQKLKKKYISIRREPKESSKDA